MTDMKARGQMHGINLRPAARDGEIFGMPCAHAHAMENNKRHRYEVRFTLPPDGRHAAFGAFDT